jgi:hypothetical protein
MADTADDKPTAAKASVKADYDDAIDTMQKQIGQMRREMSSLKRLLAERTEEVDAEGWFETASEGASRATQALRSQAQKVAGTVQDNPVTVSSALFAGGIVGLLIGMAVVSSQANHRRWYERY